MSWVKWQTGFTHTRKFHFLRCHKSEDLPGNPKNSNPKPRQEHQVLIVWSFVSISFGYTCVITVTASRLTNFLIIVGHYRWSRGEKKGPVHKGPSAMRAILGLANSCLLRLPDSWVFVSESDGLRHRLTTTLGTVTKCRVSRQPVVLIKPTNAV